MEFSGGGIVLPAKAGIQENKRKKLQEGFLIIDVGNDETDKEIQAPSKNCRGRL